MSSALFFWTDAISHTYHIVVSLLLRGDTHPTNSYFPLENQKLRWKLEQSTI